MFSRRSARTTVWCLARRLLAPNPCSISPSRSGQILLDCPEHLSDEWSRRWNAQVSCFQRPARLKAAVKTFVVDSADCARAFALREAARKCRDGTSFATEKEFASASTDWPMSRLVAIWNKLPGAKPVSKFKDRSTALRRIWAAISALEPETRTKVELVIGLLSQPAGATLKEIMAATGWQAHSVRGFISGQLSKRLGFEVKSFKRQGERAYRISLRKPV